MTATYVAPTFVADLQAGLLETAAATLDPVPDRLLATFGKEPAWDCSMLAVTIPSIRPATIRARGGIKSIVDDAGPIEPVGVTPFVLFDVTLIRCGDPAVDGNFQPVIPSVDAINAWGRMQSTDGWSLWYGLIAAHHAGVLFGANPGFRAVCARTNIGEAAPLGPKGGFGGWRITVTTNLA